MVIILPISGNMNFANLSCHSSLNLDHDRIFLKDCVKYRGKLKCGYILNNTFIISDYFDACLCNNRSRLNDIHHFVSFHGFKQTFLADSSDELLDNSEWIEAN